MGFGAGLLSALPINTGNESVYVRPYKIFSEFNLSVAYIISKNNFAFIPTLSVINDLGFKIIKRKVLAQKDSSIKFFYAPGLKARFAFFVGRWGGNIDYALLFYSSAISQVTGLSFSYKI